MHADSLSYEPPGKPKRLTKPSQLESPHCNKDPAKPKVNTNNQGKSTGHQLALQVKSPLPTRPPGCVHWSCFLLLREVLKDFFGHKPLFRWNLRRKDNLAISECLAIPTLPLTGCVTLDRVLAMSLGLNSIICIMVLSVQFSHSVVSSSL